MKRFAHAITLSGLLIGITLSANAGDVPLVGNGSNVTQRPVDMMRWQERIFKDSTTYRSVVLAGERVLRAESENSASALYQSRHIDLQQTPYLHWRWMIEKSLGDAIDEHTKAGDDYPARIYVIRNGGLAFWRTKAINYVWSSGRPADTRWDNPFAGPNVQMWALDSGDQNAGEWQEHIRNIRDDWFEAFGEDINTLDGLALMTDTDNTRRSLRAWYADIVFSSNP